MMKGHGGGGASSDKDREAFAAAVAAVVRTPHRGFMVIKQEWAAIRIQTLFRGFLVSGTVHHFPNFNFNPFA